MTATGADWLEYQAFPDEVGTDEFTYAVEDWVGQRAVATIRVGISPRPTGSATVVARDDEVTVRPGQRVEVRVLANDVDSSGGELTLETDLQMAEGIDAEVEDRRIVVQAPDEPGVLQIAYTASNERGGRDTGGAHRDRVRGRPGAAAHRARHRRARDRHARTAPRSPSTCSRSRRTRAGR